MVTQPRKPIPRPSASKARRVYVREWRRHKKVKAVDCAIALDIERESYLRLERTPHKFNNGEMAILADLIGIKPSQFWFPPPAPGQERVSLDDMIEDIPEPMQQAAILAVRGMAGK